MCIYNIKFKLRMLQEEDDEVQKAEDTQMLRTMLSNFKKQQTYGSEKIKTMLRME